RRHTSSYGDWSSDVCSSDLRHRRPVHGCFVDEALVVDGAVGDTNLQVHALADRWWVGRHGPVDSGAAVLVQLDLDGLRALRVDRSEERRVGKELRTGG